MLGSNRVLRCPEAVELIIALRGWPNSQGPLKLACEDAPARTIEILLHNPIVGPTNECFYIAVRNKDAYSVITVLLNDSNASVSVRV